MKIYLKFLFLALHLFFCDFLYAQTHYQEIIRNENKKIQAIHTYNQNHILDGETAYFYPNENIKTIINFVDGKANGIIYKYHLNNILESSGLLIDDMAEGVFEYFHENGANKQKILYIKNKINTIQDCFSYKKEKVYCGAVNNGNGFINLYDKKGKLIGKDIIKNGIMVKRETVN